MTASNNHGVAMVVAETKEMVATEETPLETPTHQTTSTPCSPPSKKSNSKEKEVGAQTGATHIYQTQGQTQTQTQKETVSLYVAATDYKEMYYKGSLLSSYLWKQ